MSLPPSPYVFERQTEYWTSRQVEEYFLDDGYEVCVLPIPAHIEYLLPADFIFFDKAGAKLFGFQYKALYRNPRDHWNLDERQHTTLQLYPWISYCLSELRNYRQLRSSLHLARIADTNFEYTRYLYPEAPKRFSNYRRWASFFNKVEECSNGVIVASVDDLKQILMANAANEVGLQTIAQIATDIFLVHFAQRRVIHYSPWLKPSILPQS